MKGIYVVLLWEIDGAVDGEVQLLSDRTGRPLTYTYKRSAATDAKAWVKKEQDEMGDDWRFRVVELNEKGGY